MGRREQAAASRDTLVAAAQDCFAEYGYDATTVAEILWRADMARGALYHYFPDGKAGIFAAVYARVDDLLHAELDRLDATRTHLDAIRAGLAVYLRFCTQDAYSRITILDAPRVIPDQRWPRPLQAGRAYDRLRDELAAARGAGEIALPDLNAATAALYGVAQELGAHIYAATDRAVALPAATATIDLLIDGLAATAVRDEPTAGGTDRTAATVGKDTL